jgi:predicted phosphoribosyltransferase
MAVVVEITAENLAEESRRQRAEIARCLKRYRPIQPPLAGTGHALLVTDDSILTGSTMIPALQQLRGQGPYELIAAVPVASLDRLREVRRWCEDDVWLVSSGQFQAIDEFYEGFPAVDDEQGIDLLPEFAPLG